MRLPLVTALAAGVALAPAAGAQMMAPTNDAPNPYTTVTGWAKMPEGREWGSTSAVAIDKDGVSVWVAERCGQNDCVGRDVDPVLHFDANGNLIRSFGKGMVRSPHGIHVDRDGNVWVVDCSCTGAGGGGRGGRGGGAPAPAPTDGHQIHKFSPDGKLLMTLGKAGGDTAQGAIFYQPNNMTTAPNGDIWVVEGHSSQSGVSPARVIKLDKTGKVLGTWGTVYDQAKTDEPYAFNQPHAVALDSRGRLFVADRGNDRLKIFDSKDMKLLDTWYQFSRISGLWIDANDVIYAADSESGSVNPPHWAWKRGIRVGSARDGKVTAFIPDPDPTCYSRIEGAGAPASAGSTQQPCANNTWAAEGVAVDRNGVIYGAEVGPKGLKRYVKK